MGKRVLVVARDLFFRSKLAAVVAAAGGDGVRHYSRRTEEAYVGWVRRFVRFCGMRHPADLGAEDVRRFLTSLATERVVAAATQNQAASSLVFLYSEVLGQPLGALGEVVRAKEPGRLPIVLSKDEVSRVIGR